MIFDNLVFVNYVPGSYGSFITHCLRDQIRTDIFTETNTTHKYEDDPFPLLHGYDTTVKWAESSHSEKIESIKKFNDVYLHRLEQSNNLQIQRITYPKSTKLLQQYFPGSKIIKISIQPYFVYHVAENIIKKIENIPISEAVGFVCDNIDNEIIDGVYDLRISMILKGTIVTQINHVRDFIGVSANADISNLYEEFRQRNGIKYEMAK